MNFYKISGQVTAQMSFFLKNLGFKNIKSFDKNSNGISLRMKNGKTAGIRLLNPGVYCLCWSIHDFESRAVEQVGIDWWRVYNESKFDEAVKLMLEKHDATMGITWDTVDYYLDTYCIY